MMAAPPVARAKPLACPNCGGPIDFRTFGRTISVVCPQCKSVLDASNPVLETLQRTQLEQNERTPTIPLGTRGTFKGVPWEVIGFQTRAVTEDDETFEWEEYLLFNPYKGFRYLIHYEGHWSFVSSLEPMPTVIGTKAYFERHTYKHFSTAPAKTTFVLGEFPWRVKINDWTNAADYVDPPLILSSEETNNEITWSQGEYIPGAEIWKAFQLPGAPPPAKGIYLNQPSPYKGRVWGIWKMFFLMEFVLFALMIAFRMISSREVVLDEHHTFSTAEKGEPSFVTAPFELKGRAAPVELDVSTDLSNESAYFNFALINQDTGQAFDFGKEVSYYFGSDSDGNWSEGAAKEEISLPRVPPGHYYLRVEPEMDTETAEAKSVSYQLKLIHNAPSSIWFLFAMFLLIIPPIWVSIRSASFETRRWANSDHPIVKSGGSSSSDD
jgi:hypothetical protein